VRRGCGGDMVQEHMWEQEEGGHPGSDFGNTTTTTTTSIWFPHLNSTHHCPLLPPFQPTPFPPSFLPPTDAPPSPPPWLPGACGARPVGGSGGGAGGAAGQRAGAAQEGDQAAPEGPGHGEWGWAVGGAQEGRAGVEKGYGRGWWLHPSRASWAAEGPGHFEEGAQQLEGGGADGREGGRVCVLLGGGWVSVC
jgi:hypothetical protein